MNPKEWAKVKAMPADVRALLSTELRHICGEMVRTGGDKPLWDFIYEVGYDLYPEGMKNIAKEKPEVEIRREGTYVGRHDNYSEGTLEDSSAGDIRLNTVNIPKPKAKKATSVWTEFEFYDASLKITKWTYGQNPEIISKPRRIPNE